MLRRFFSDTISSGPFEARIDEDKLVAGVNMILVTLGESEFYFHRINHRINHK